MQPPGSPARRQLGDRPRVPASSPVLPAGQWQSGIGPNVVCKHLLDGLVDQPTITAVVAAGGVQRPLGCRTIRLSRGATPTRHPSPSASLSLAPGATPSRSGCATEMPERGDARRTAPKAGQRNGKRWIGVGERRSYARMSCLMSSCAEEWGGDAVPPAEPAPEREASSPRLRGRRLERVGPAALLPTFHSYAAVGLKRPKRAIRSNHRLGDSEARQPLRRRVRRVSNSGTPRRASRYLLPMRLT